MRTTEIVDELVALHNGWSRDGDHGVLRYLNMANSILKSIDAEQNVLYGTDGELPPIDTTETVFLYTMPTTVRRVAYIVAKSSEISKDYGRSLAIQPPNSFVYGGIDYVRIPCVKTKDRIYSSAPAIVRFTADPGTHTSYYRRVSYGAPTEILSENIQHDIPEPYDTMYLLPAASLLIAGIQNYTFQESIQHIRAVIVPQLSEELGAGEQGEWDSEPVTRDF